MTQKQIRQNNMDKLAQLFGAKTGIKTSSPCCGKWARTTDYFIKIDNGTEMFISNGMKSFDEILEKYISQYENFILNKEKIVSAFKEMSIRDNEIAKEKGLKSYTVLDIDFYKGNSGHLGWFYIVLEVGEKIFKMIETNANWAIANNKLENYLKGRENYFVAGAIKESDSDYVFGNVGFSSEGTLYKLIEKTS